MQNPKFGNRWTSSPLFAQGISSPRLPTSLRPLAAMPARQCAVAGGQRLRASEALQAGLNSQRDPP